MLIHTVRGLKWGLSGSARWAATILAYFGIQKGQSNFSGVQLILPIGALAWVNLVLFG